MDRIDRYILRQFVMTFFFGILAFVTIYIAVDLMEHLDKFLDAHMSGLLIVKYYLYGTPDIIQLVVPIAMLLSSLFTIGRLDTTSELTAIRAGGRSMRRIVLPLFAFGLAVSCSMIYFSGWTVPQTNKLRGAMDRKYLGKNIIGGEQNVHLRLSPTLNLSIDYYDPGTGLANRVSLERIDTAEKVELARVSGRVGEQLQLQSDSSIGIGITERIDAASMHFDSTKKVWVLSNGVARNFENGKIVATPFVERPLPGIPLTPKELNLSQQNVSELDLSEFRQRVDRERLGGRDINRLMVDYYSRFAFPFSAIIVVFFGIPFSSGQRKGGAALTVAVTALVSALYLVFTEVSKTFTYGAHFPPLLTAWMANIVFLSIGLVNLLRVERT